MKNIIFIDVDGTLVEQDGSVPQSSKRAIQKAKKAGHEIIICTGRSMGEITKEISDLYPSGYIAAGGSYIEYENKVRQHIKFKEQDVKEIITYLKRHGIAYYLETNDGIYASSNCISKIKEATIATLALYPNRFTDPENPYPDWFFEIFNKTKNLTVPYHEINKLSFINTEVPFQKIKNKFKDKFEIYETTIFEFGENSGEIGLKGLDKKDGILKLLNMIEGPFKTYAFGDGLNDISMFEAVDVKIAMRNGHSRLKDYADQITDTVENDGLYKGFVKNNLL